MLKKTIAISLLFILLFAYSGYWIVFKFQQFAIRSEVKKEIKNGIHNDQLTRFVLADLEQLPPNMFNWVHAKEFKLKGEFYDIIKTEINGDTTFLYCFHDLKESSLFASLDRIIAMKMGHQKPLHQQASSLNHLLKSLFIFQSCHLNSNIYVSFKLNTDWSNLYKYLGALNIFTPPD